MISLHAVHFLHESEKNPSVYRVCDPLRIINGIMFDWIVNTKIKARVWRTKAKSKKAQEEGHNLQEKCDNEAIADPSSTDTDRPPPLPPRQRRVEVPNPSRRERKTSTSSLNDHAQKYEVNSWPNRMHKGYKLRTKSDTNLSLYHEPAQKKRDSFSKRSSNYPEIALPSSASSSNGSIDEQTLSDLGSPLSNMSNSSFSNMFRGADRTMTCAHQFDNIKTMKYRGNRHQHHHHGVAFYHKRANSEKCSTDFLVVPSLRHSTSSASIKSCPEIGDVFQDLSPVSPNESPLLDKKCTFAQCGCCITHSISSSSKRSKPRPQNLSHSSRSFDTDRTASVSRRRAVLKSLPKRPSSFGHYDSSNQHVEVRSDCACRQQKMCHSSSCIQPPCTSPIYPKTTSRRRHASTSNDIGSISDLENICESNFITYSFDVSRENSLVSEEEVANLCGDLRTRLAVQSETDTTGYVKVLPSPRVSPDIFLSPPGVVVTSDSDETSDSQNLPLHKGQNFLSVPKKVGRRGSALSLTSNSEESDCEPSPPLSRRGRRAAIVDTKNVGDVSPTNLSPEMSPSNSCDEGENASNIAQRLRRRRSSLELAMSIYPGDLLVQEHHKKLLKRNTVSDFHNLRSTSAASGISEEGKKGRQTFSLLKLMKSRSKEALSKLEDVLAKMAPSEFKDNYLAVYKNLHWSDLIASSDKQTEQQCLSEMERKRREAVWELFKSECVFLIDHLMVLKHCFMEPLKKVQVEGHLMYAEPQDLFGNLDEICYVSYTFCKDFIAALLKGMSSTEFGSTNILLKAFDRFSSHSKDGDIYHTYCINYTNALTYLDQLRRRDDFQEFERWCEQDSRCKRLQLTDLLVAPMQHCTKLPLLLNNIRKYTENLNEANQLSMTIERVESSLQNMEDKMKWIKNYERVQEVQRQLSWPSVTDMDPRIFIPEYLKRALMKQPCERLLACPKRQLLHEGQLTLIENAKSTDVYLFLFDDILLVTKIKKSARKKQTQLDVNVVSTSDKISYTVHKQPVALDRLSVHDVSQAEAAVNGIKCAFVLVQISRFQQIIGVFTLQCPNDVTKNAWLENLCDAKDAYNSNAEQTHLPQCSEDSFPMASCNGSINTQVCSESTSTQWSSQDISEIDEDNFHGRLHFDTLPLSSRKKRNCTIYGNPPKSLSVDSVYI